MSNEKERHKLFEAWAFCDLMDQSTEYTIQYMANSANVDFDTALKFIQTESSNRMSWYNENKGWENKYKSIIKKI